MMYDPNSGPMLKTDKNYRPMDHNKGQQQQIIPALAASSISCSAFFQKQQGDARLCQQQLLGPFDIICGRTSTAFNNQGNKRFRQTITLNLQRYMDAPTRHAKSVVIVSVVKILRHDIGARFLKQIKTTGKFVELSKKQCREKVGHALRDLAAQINPDDCKSTSTTKSSIAKGVSCPQKKNHTSMVDAIPSSVTWKENIYSAVREEKEDVIEATPIPSISLLEYSCPSNKNDGDDGEDSISVRDEYELDEEMCSNLLKLVEQQQDDDQSLDPLPITWGL